MLKQHIKFLHLTYVVGTVLIRIVLANHNIWFYKEIIKHIFSYDQIHILSVSLKSNTILQKYPQCNLLLDNVKSCRHKKMSDFRVR